MSSRPELAKAAKGDLTRLQRLDPDAQTRQLVESALAASNRASSGRSIFSLLLGWLIPLVICTILASLAWYGFRWAKSHALIPGL